MPGKAAPLTVYWAIAARALLGADPTLPYATPFVGRSDERTLLRAAFSRSIRDSSCHMITISGEPGIGKTRLVADLFAYIDGNPDLLVRWRRGRCLAYGEGITFWALGEIVKAEAGIFAADEPVAIRSKLEINRPFQLISGYRSPATNAMLHADVEV